MKQRAEELTELMDDPAVGPGELASALKFIRGVNRHLGGTAAVMGYLREWLPREMKAGERPIRILDVATGSADIPEAIALLARQREIHVEMVGLDLHPATLELARQWTEPVIKRCAPHASLELVMGDALALPFADGSMDYVLCSMFLHHLSSEDALRAVREMRRVARRGIVINDLLRSRWAYAAIWALTMFASRIDKHDARVSVKKGWRAEEIKAWPGVLGAEELAYRGHLFSRFTLAGRR